jgi:hypothetical protein
MAESFVAHHAHNGLPPQKIARPPNPLPGSGVVVRTPRVAFPPVREGVSGGCAATVSAALKALSRKIFAKRELLANAPWS